jgi:hypothetical protein
MDARNAFNMNYMNSILARKKLGSQDFLLAIISPRLLEEELNDTAKPTLRLIVSIRSFSSETGGAHQ